MENKKKICGVGINDSWYPTVKREEYPRINGKRRNHVIWECMYYRKWRAMIERCYSEAALKRMPCYVGCSVCDEWLTFSNFHKWVDEQPERNWADKGMQLDKDMLHGDSKVYSPDNCVFVASLINGFVIDKTKTSGKYMMGVSDSHSKSFPYLSRCNDPFKRPENKNRFVGRYDNEYEAHQAWKAKKHEYALELIESGIVKDERLIPILQSRYLPETVHE